MENPLDVLRTRQALLAEKLDLLKHAEPGSDQFMAAFVQVDAFADGVLDAGQAVRDAEDQRYRRRTLAIGAVLVVVTAATGLCALLGLISIWLLALTTPLLVIGLHLSARDLLPPWISTAAHFKIGVLALVAVGLTAGAGFVSAWFLLAAVPATGVTVAWSARGWRENQGVSRG
jgi:hypothetical protein